jgi:hypothetical protein
MMKKLPRRNIYWRQYAFFPAHEFGVPTEYAEYYKLPESKIEGLYNL